LKDLKLGKIREIFGTNIIIELEEIQEIHSRRNKHSFLNEFDPTHIL
jgi:hypothetical protein